MTATSFGTPVALPENTIEDRAYFSLRQIAEARDYYRTEGYTVLRGLLPAALCDEVRRAFDAQIRFTRTPILRQKDMRYERNTFDKNGFLANPIFNIQDLETRRHGSFKQAALRLLTLESVTAAVRALLADDEAASVKLVQSMFFEGAAATWPHQDSYYQDSAAQPGRATAGWFALEDIHAGAGRFYICPKSHLLPVIENSGELNFGSGHERYKETMRETILQHGLECRAPCLRKGDVLFWSARTIHGSLPGMAPGGLSRASLTAHYLREEDELLQFHSRIRRQKMTRVNGVATGTLHDQDDWRNRLLRTAAFRVPRLWAYARKVTIHMVTSHKQYTNLKNRIKKQP